MRKIVLSSLVVAATSGTAIAAEVPPLIRAELSTSRHYTDNALDDALAVSDWYTLLRGSVAGDLEHELGKTTLTFDGELRRFDSFTIENDASAGVEAQTTARVSDDLELRGTLYLRHVREGDALVIDDLAIGTLTGKTIAGTSVIVGLRLAPDLVSTSELRGFHERAQDTLFQDDLIPALRLEPDRTRVAFSQGLTHSANGRSLGVRATAERTVFDGTFSEAIDLDRFQLRGEAGWQAETGHAVAIAAGAEWLRASFDLIDIVRPSIEATAVVPMAGVELRGTFRMAIDTDDTDDLLASWLRRGQIELAIPIHERLALSTGLFLEKRDNLVLDYAEDRRGLYGEIGWQAAQNVTLVLRLDYREDTAPEIDFRKERLDASVSLRTRL